MFRGPLEKNQEAVDYGDGREKGLEQRRCCNRESKSHGGEKPSRGQNWALL